MHLIAGAFAYYINGFYAKLKKYPRGPAPYPVIGNVLDCSGSGPHGTMIEKFAPQFDGVFTTYIPIPIVILTTYEAIKEAFLDKGEDFAGRARGKVLDAIQIVPNGGVLLSNGSEWKEQRRTALSILRDFGMGRNLMEEQVRSSVNLRALDETPDKDRVDMRWHIQLMVANIINEVLFGFRYKYDDCASLTEYVNKFAMFVETVSESKLFVLANFLPFIDKIPYLGWKAVGQHRANIFSTNEYIFEQVARCLNDFDEGTDESSCFVHAYRQKMPNNQNLTIPQLQATCADFFATGQETTTTTLRWAVLLLATHPEIQEKLRSEVLQVVGTDRLPSMADKAKMPYASACIIELQRWANIIITNVMHRTTVDTEVKGQPIPNDTIIIGDIHYIMSHDPLFTNPQEFRPERFLRSDGVTLNKELVDHYLPFSIGKRACAGEGLAKVELFLGLLSTEQHYRLMPTPGEDFAGRARGKVLDAIQIVPNGGVLLSNGSEWKEQRRTALSILRDFGMGRNLMEEQVRSSVNLRALDETPDKDRVDMRWHIQLMVANIINEVLFGFRYKYDDCASLTEYVNKFAMFVETVSESKLFVLANFLPFIDKIPYLGWKAVGQHRANIFSTNEYIFEQVARCLNDFDEGTDESSCFVHAYRQKMPNNQNLTIPQLQATCADFFATGQETTTTTLRWAVLLLATHPEIQEKLRSEVLQVVGTDRLPSMADKAKMPYASACIIELQRWANIIITNVMHRTTVDTEVKGQPIPNDTIIIGDIHYIMSHDPLFTNPQEFRPERFLRSDGVTLNKELVDHYLPFSIGKRACAGEGLAKVELFLGLLSTEQHYRLMPTPGETIDLRPTGKSISLPRTQTIRLEKLR